MTELTSLIISHMTTIISILMAVLIFNIGFVAGKYWATRPKPAKDEDNEDANLGV